MRRAGQGRQQREVPAQENAVRSTGVQRSRPAERRTRKINARTASETMSGDVPAIPAGDATEIAAETLPAGADLAAPPDDASPDSR